MKTEMKNAQNTLHCYVFRASRNSRIPTNAMPLSVIQSGPNTALFERWQLSDL